MCCLDWRWMALPLTLEEQLWASVVCLVNTEESEAIYRTGRWKYRLFHCYNSICLPLAVLACKPMIRKVQAFPFYQFGFRETTWGRNVCITSLLCWLVSEVPMQDSGSLWPISPSENLIPADFLHSCHISVRAALLWPCCEAVYSSSSVLLCFETGES